ncbi:MAG: ABC transporter ATP-binding protein [Candidatus Omnitrophota bacterium]|nr:ABC transporter ATP-binding protein [Candidatus Omnitrophota bacterium]
MKIFRKFLSYIAPFWKIEALAILLSGLSMAFGLVTPYLAKLIIDKAYPDKNLKLFVILISAIGIIFILGNLFKGIGNYLTRYVKLRVSLNLNKRVFKKFQRLPYGFFQDTSTGENLYKINYDIEQVTQFIADILPQTAVLIPKSLFILGLILYINPGMFIFVLVLTPFMYIGPFYFTKKLKESWKIWVENSQKVFKKLQETLSHMHLIKAHGKERPETRSYMKGVISNTRLRLKNTKIEVTASFFNSAIQKAILGLIVFYGGYQVIKGRMTLGSLSAISIYLSQLSGVQTMFANFIQQASSGLVSCERLDKVLEYSGGSIENRDAKSLEFYKGGIEFKNVVFGYNGGKKILDNVSFSIQGGSFIALTGPSGCGKTTIINLILRLYRPLSGEIFIDGNDINGIKAESLYSQIGCVLQEPYLWNDTIANNISYGKKDSCLNDIEEAAKIACADNFIQALPNGYDTVIGENACKISEGQKQRIAIARALIKKPKILILDEALSSVDMELENNIIENIKSFLKNTTLIVISHRISTVKRADIVYFISEPEEMISQMLLNGQAKWKRLF